ncbi:Pentafunctional AROM polypeptide [Orobanche hederae]
MLTSDMISTVSEGYASEIPSAEGGNGLHEVLCYL